MGDRRPLGPASSRRLLIIGVAIALVASIGGCGTSDEGPDSPQPAGEGQPAAQETTGYTPPDSRLFIPGVSTGEVFTSFRKAGLECRNQVFDLPATETTPQAVGRNCTQENEEGLAPLAGVTVADPSHVDVLVLEMKDSGLDVLAKEDVLEFFKVITQVPFEGVDLQAVDQWLEAEVLVQSTVDLGIGNLVFTLSGTEYRQLLTVRHSGSCFSFTYVSERRPTEEEREACMEIAKASG